MSAMSPTGQPSKVSARTLSPEGPGTGRAVTGDSSTGPLSPSLPSQPSTTTGKDGKEKERKIEKAVSDTLQRVSADEIDLAELRLVLRRFKNVDAALEAHRLAQWASSKGETLTFPLRMLERWLEKARPMATEKKPKGKGAISEVEIVHLCANRRSLLARCRVWEGTRPEGTLREVPMFTEEELDAEAAQYEAELRRAA